MRKILFIIVLIIPSLFLQAQMEWKEISKETLAEEFKRINEKSLTRKQYVFDIKHEVFDGFQKIEPIEEYSGLMARDNENYYTNTFQQITAQNEFVKLIFLEEQKEVYLTYPDSSVLKAMNIPDFIKQLEYSEKIETTIIGNKQYYSIDFKKGAYVEKMTISINEYDWVEKTEVYMNINQKDVLQQSKIVITFKNFDFDTSTNDERFIGLSTMVKFNKSAFEIDSKHKSFQIVDLRANTANN